MLPGLSGIERSVSGASRVAITSAPGHCEPHKPSQQRTAEILRPPARHPGQRRSEDRLAIHRRGLVHDRSGRPGRRVDRTSGGQTFMAPRTGNDQDRSGAPAGSSRQLDAGPSTYPAVTKPRRWWSRSSTLTCQPPPVTSSPPPRARTLQFAPDCMRTVRLTWPVSERFQAAESLPR